MTLDEKLKEIEQRTKASLGARLQSLPAILAALRKCREQRESLSKGRIFTAARAGEVSAFDAELLKILEGE